MQGLTGISFEREAQESRLAKKINLGKLGFLHEKLLFDML